MARTQKNKNTAYHLGTLKAKLAKLRRDLLTPKGGSGGASEGKNGEGGGGWFVKLTLSFLVTF